MRPPVPLLVGAFLLAACPERKVPERGVELRYRAKEGQRAVVERRFALAGLTARVSADADTLVVRVPDGEDATQVKAALARVGRLEVCEEREDAAQRLCDAAAPPAGFSVERESSETFGCFLEGPGAAAVLDAGVALLGERVLVQRSPRGARTFAARPACLSPAITDARTRDDPSLGEKVVQVTLDAEGARAFEALTARVVKHRLLVVLDGEVLLAPVVMAPIPGGKLQLMLGRSGPGVAEQAAVALAGGTLEGLELISEQRFGPPSLVPGR